MAPEGRARVRGSNGARSRGGSTAVARERPIYGRCLRDGNSADQRSLVFVARFNRSIVVYR
jgi:hypothetical protein